MINVNGKPVPWGYVVGTAAAVFLLGAGYYVCGLRAELAGAVRECERLKAELSGATPGQQNDQVVREVRLRLKELRAELSDPARDRKEVLDRYEKEVMHLLRVHPGRLSTSEPLDRR